MIRDACSNLNPKRFANLLRSTDLNQMICDPHSKVLISMIHETSFQIETWEHNHKSLNSRNDSQTHNKVLIWIKWFTNLLWSDWSVLKQWFLWYNVSKSSNYDKKGSLTSFFFLWLRWERGDDNKANKRQLWLYQHAISLRKKDETKMYSKNKTFPKNLLFSSKKETKYCGLLYTPLLRKLSCVRLPDIKEGILG